MEHYKKDRFQCWELFEDFRVLEQLVILDMMVVFEQVGTVVGNSTIREARYSEFSRKICIFTLIKLNSFKNWSQLIMHSEESSLNEL